jgi:hypothetical protein
MRLVAAGLQLFIWGEEGGAGAAPNTFLLHVADLLVIGFFQSKVQCFLM